jgi:L-histidine N-alpha-methyltransferase
LGTARFEMIRSGRAEDRVVTMAREVRAGLTETPRSIPPKYFYDEEGSRLFDAICRLPEYYLTRAEHALLERHADDVVDRVRPWALVEIGSGMARKTRLLVQAMASRSTSQRYVAFDIAPAAIEASAEPLLRSHPGLSVRGVVGDFAGDLRRIALAAPPSSGPRLFAFLGSTIGNLDEVEAPDLLRRVSSLMTTADGFLLGIDLVKEERALHAAYNDAAGVTAAFNRNVLRVISQELQGDADPSAFDHLAFYDGARERIEMHLVSKRRQAFSLRAIDLRVEVAEGERILTEISRKFTRASAERLLTAGGMRLERWLAADDGAFALVLARARATATEKRGP